MTISNQLKKDWLSVYQSAVSFLLLSVSFCVVVVARDAKDKLNNILIDSRNCNTKISSTTTLIIWQKTGILTCIRIAKAKIKLFMECQVIKT